MATIQVRKNENEFYLYESQENRVIIHSDTFKTSKEARLKAMEIIANVDYPLYLIADQTKQEQIEEEQKFLKLFAYFN